MISPAGQSVHTADSKHRADKRADSKHRADKRTDSKHEADKRADSKHRTDKRADSKDGADKSADSKHRADKRAEKRVDTKHKRTADNWPAHTDHRVNSTVCSMVNACLPAVVLGLAYVGMKVQHWGLWGGGGGGGRVIYN